MMSTYRMLTFRTKIPSFPEIRVQSMSLKIKNLEKGEPVRIMPFSGLHVIGIWDEVRDDTGGPPPRDEDDDHKRVVAFISLSRM